MRARFNPWIVLGFEVLLVTASETMLKIGASETRKLAGWEWTGVIGLSSMWIWGAICLVIMSFLCWIYVLRHIALSIAFPMSNVVHVLVRGRIVASGGPELAGELERTGYAAFESAAREGDAEDNGPN